jgi:hypothetical protein
MPASFNSTGHCNSRLELISDLLNRNSSTCILEIGVWKGDLTEYLLENVPTISNFHLLDPWESLSNWNKPYNISNDDFQAIYEQCMKRLQPYSKKVTVHRSTSLEVRASSMPKFDTIYIDGDHTLRGITIDLLKAKELVAKNGIIICDDYCTNTVYQHGMDYEPTFVHPYVDYFCEANNWKCIPLQFNQLLIVTSDPFDVSRPKPAVLPLLIDVATMSPKTFLNRITDFWARVMG